MSDPNRFAAEILEHGAAALAAEATDRLFAAVPAARERFADGEMKNWKAHLRQRILELAAAVRMGEPRLFTSRVLWTRKAFAARGVNDMHLGDSLVALQSVLRDKMPENVVDLTILPVEAAVEALKAASSSDDVVLGASDPHAELALRYLAHVLEGDSQKAIALILEAMQSGMTLSDILERVLIPAQHEVGRMWHEAESDVAEEHLATATTLRTIAVAAREAEPTPPLGKTVLAAAVAGNEHDVPVHAISVLFESRGWRAVCLGSNVPAEDIVRSVQYFGADLLVLSVTLAVQLKEAERAIAAVRSLPDVDLRVLVGGQAFSEGSDLWKRIGADGYAPSLTDAVDVGGRLLSVSG